MVFDVKSQGISSELLDTPSLPKGVEKVELTENAHQVFARPNRSTRLAKEINFNKKSIKQGDKLWLAQISIRIY